MDRKEVRNLVTVGYMDEGALERVQAFMDNPFAVLVDIRYSPRSRWRPQWNKKALQALYGSSRYTHVQELGNVNYNRPDLPIQLLDPNGCGLLVYLLQQGYSLLLLCACKEYDRCHRKTVYELVCRELNDKPLQDSNGLP